MLKVFFFLFFYLVLLLSIGLMTVTERFFLSLSQVRLGPQKVSFLAFLQMVFDGLKLFFSDLVYVKKNS